MNDFNSDNSNQKENFDLRSINFNEGGNNNVTSANKKKRVCGFKLKRKILFKVSLSVLVAVFCGNLIGFGIGYFIPKAERYIETLNDVDIDTSAENVGESFKKTTSNTIVNTSKSVVSLVAVSDNNQRNIFETSRESESIGSGIIFHQTSENVYIVTNYHVISGAKNVNVSFGDNKYVSANLVGKHQVSDIAVISIKKEALRNIGVNSVKTAYFGNSDKLNVGDNVIAIGNAFGDGNIATKGIISVLQTDIPISDSESLSVIQTDAAINSGNDGGALINTNGEVIGINTAKYSYYTVEGIGYSISSNLAKSVIEEIMNKKESPYLGVTVAAITEEEAEAYDLPQNGVLVQSVVSGSPADIAGIRVNDIIIRFDSTPIFTPVQLTEAVRKCNVGDNVKIKVLRNMERVITLDATILRDKSNNF